MTIEFKNTIKNELYRAFSHFGEPDQEILDEKVEIEMDNLMSFMGTSDPDVIQTDKGELTGYLVDIAVSSGLVDNERVVLQMVVGDNTIDYIINSYIVVKTDDWQPGDRFTVENEHNKLVNLEDVKPSTFY